MKIPIITWAERYAALGYSVIPVRADGSKAPLEAGWRAYSKRLPTTAELQRWFGSGQAGIGIVCGQASGCMAVLDFETAEAWDRRRERVPADTVSTLDICPIVRTPSGGVHVWCRLPEPTPGTVLARDNDKGVLIEIRGDGHQVLAPGCPASCHPSGKIYEFIQKPTDTPALIPLNVFANWCEIAAGLNEYVPDKPAPVLPQRRDRSPQDTDPGTDFNQRGTWEETGLFDAGWAWASRYDNDRGTVRRPGKSEGISGTVGMVTTRTTGNPLFYCFTSNGSPFEPSNGYDRFGVFARLKHNKDFKAAARALGAMGYGEQTTRRTPEKKSPPMPNADPAPSTEAPDPDQTTAVYIIREYFRVRYRPDFRRGNAIHTEAGELIPMGVACEVPTSKLIEQLASACDAPRFKGGAVNRDQLPGFFKKWGKVAWGDLLDALPDEDKAMLGQTSLAADEFRRLVRQALRAQLVVGDIIGSEGVTRTERRSLIDWCVKWAKPGPWRIIRSYTCWCKITELGNGEIRLMVALRHDLFAQLGTDRRLIEMGPNTFTKRAAQYGVGNSSRKHRPGGGSAVVLSDDFVSDLIDGLTLEDAPETSEVFGMF